MQYAGAEIATGGKKTKERIAASQSLISIAYCEVLATRKLEVCLSALPEKKQAAYLQGKAGMTILAMSPVETECIWQKQYFDSIVKLQFRDSLPSSYC